MGLGRHVGNDLGSARETGATHVVADRGLRTAGLELDRFERARDPSHTRTLPDVDVRQLFEANSLVLLQTRYQTHRRELEYYLPLAGCEGDAAERARALSPGGPEAYVADSAWYLLRKP